MYDNMGYVNSGVEWIGEVPSGWEIEKFKYHLQRLSIKNPGEQEILSLYRDLGIIPKDSRTDNHNITSEDTSGYRYVQPGDFVVNKMKAWQGSVAVSEYEGVVSPAYYVYAFSDGTYNKRYFHYLLRGAYKDEFRRLSGGIRVGQWDLPAESLENTLLIIPPLAEQHAIADYLDAKTAKIDTTLADIESLIEHLEAYRAALIYEVVTGKKEI